MKSIHVCYSRTGKGHHLYSYCVAKRDLPASLRVYPDEVLGRGAYGTVLAGEYEGHAVAVKFAALESPIPTVDCASIEDGGDCSRLKTSDFEQEVRDSKFAAELGVSPPFYFSKLVRLSNFKPPESVKHPLPAPDQIGVLVTGQIEGMTLKKWVQLQPSMYKQHRKQLLDQYMNIVERLAQHGVYHPDAHFGNIMILPSTLQMYFIDVTLSAIPEDMDVFHMSFRNWTLEEESVLPSKKATPGFGKKLIF